MVNDLRLVPNGKRRHGLADDRDLWERQPMESARAFAAFSRYRDMGPGQRSSAKVAQELGRSKTLMDRWSSCWSWVKRAEAWDAEQEHTRAEAMRARQLQAVEEDFQLGAALTAKAAKNLMALADAGLSAQEIVRLAHEGVVIKRLTLGMPTEVQRLTEGVPHERHHDGESDALARRILADPALARVASDFVAMLSESSNGASDPLGE